MGLAEDVVGDALGTAEGALWSASAAWLVPGMSDGKAVSFHNHVEAVPWAEGWSAG